MTKNILGLDLGVTSIGWALIRNEGKKNEILGMGSRIIPLSTDDANEFSTGNAITKNQSRTQKRTQRKGYDRYQLRRKALTEFLREHNMLPNKHLIELNQKALWGLRANAADPGYKEQSSLAELGRVFYHLNQKRGYKSSRSDANLDKKDTEYVAEVKNRHLQLKEEGKTIGQKFYEEISANQFYRTKDQVFPREAYVEEFDKICSIQKNYYPNVFTDEFIATLRDEIIYYQRKLKSQKGLVSVCDFEHFKIINKAGKLVDGGPKVAPKSSPLFQVCKIWETLNNITIKEKTGDIYEISLEKKQELFNYLNHHEKLSASELFKILKIKNSTDYYSNKQIERGIQGNLTYSAILKALGTSGDENPLLDFTLDITETDGDASLIDKKTGEVLETVSKKVIKGNVEEKGLFKLWHVIYSIADEDECKKALMANFNFDEETASRLSKIDFTKSGFGNKSTKAMRKILPYLMDGYKYSDACELAGYNHSNSLTKDENLKRQLLAKIPNLSKNSLRQPVVEKILNQMINVVNAIIEKYGKPDEIRVELARELKQSKDERNETFANLNKRERENEQIRKRLTGEYGIRATRNNVIKWRLFHEINNDESKANATCIYCGKMFGITDALTGNNVDVEHIIPKSLLFDDSQSNKTLSHVACNKAKGNRTAFDYMSGKPEAEFQEYVERINTLYKNKIIGKAKRDKLLMAESKIPKDFIERQIRETQYISRKAKEILNQVCFNVWATSGSVTEYLRRIWGWDDVLMNLQLPKYKELGLTDTVTWETNVGQKHEKEVITGWSKRDDHRHHAIDALVIACTQQGYIQRINTLSSKHSREIMYNEVKDEMSDARKKQNLLEMYIQSKRPFTTKEIEEKAASILISFKAGKKVTTPGVRKIKKNGKKVVVQNNIIIPRGALSEESVYGKIKALDKKKPVKYLFENPHLILKKYIKELVLERLEKFNSDVKLAVKSLSTDPIYLDAEKKTILEWGTCYKEEVVMKYPVEGLKPKDAEYIVDEHIKRLVKARFADFAGKEKEAFKTPLYYDIDKAVAIKSVRLFTGLSAVVPVKKDEDGNDIGFVKPGNNHHIAIYKDEAGKLQEHVCTFWHAVERKKFGLPVIIKNPKETWDTILNSVNNLPEQFKDMLPNDKWEFVTSLQQNEMYILGLSNEEIETSLADNNLSFLSNFLYLTWAIAEGDYWFRHHLETKNSELKKIENAAKSNRFHRLSLSGFFKKNPIKAIVTNLGEIQISSPVIVQM